MIRIETGDTALDETLKALTEKLHIPSGADFTVCSPSLLPKDITVFTVVICNADEVTPLREAFGDRIQLITHPLSFSAFADIVASLPCEAPKKSIPKSKSAKQFTFDRVTGVLTKGEASVTLTPKESKLFTYLLSRSPRAVSREELRSALWSETSGTNAPDVYISYLRRKLRAIFGDGVLVNERGVGYILKNII